MREVRLSDKWRTFIAGVKAGLGVGPRVVYTDGKPRPLTPEARLEAALTAVQARSGLCEHVADFPPAAPGWCHDCIDCGIAYIAREWGPLDIKWERVR